MNTSNQSIWDKALKSIKNAYNFLVGIPIMKFLKVVIYIVIILSVYLVFNWLNRESNMGAFKQASEEVVKSTTKKAFVEGSAEADSLRIAQKMKEASISDEVDDNLNDLSLGILNTLNADRSFISLFHDGAYTSGHIDYKFMDECFEKTNKERNISRITGYFRDPNKRYTNIPTRELPIYRYLREHDHEMFIGTTEELSKIDTDYATKMTLEKMGYVAMIYIQEDGLPLSIISVSWRKSNLKLVPSMAVIENALKKLAVEAKPYLYIDAYNAMKQSMNNV